jgi:hypothetical protein
MTKLLEKAIEAARKLSAEEQDEIAYAILAAASGSRAPIALSDEEKRAIANSKRAASSGDFAAEAEVASVWRKHGL